MRNFLLPALTALAFTFAAAAQGAAAEATTTTPEILELETVTVVAGVQPGPGLWKVTRGENLMWILGTVAPVPTGRWNGFRRRPTPRWPARRS